MGIGEMRAFLVRLVQNQVVRVIVECQISRIFGTNQDHEYDTIPAQTP